MLSRMLFTPLILALITACATTGATYRSGVGDAFLARAPWYAGARAVTLGDAPVGVLPIGFQPGASQAAIFDPRHAPGSPVATLLAEMNRYLDSLAAVPGAPLVRLEVAPGGTAPDVYFGCLTTGNLAGEDCTARGDSALGRSDQQRMRLAIGRPSAPWVAAVGEAMGARGARHTMVITLEVGQYLIRQTGIAGRKVVELGTDHAATLPWLTSLEAPVYVLQLTGALIDQTGQAVRIGAEGIALRSSRLVASAFGIQELFSDADVEAVRTARRRELPGEPLAWQVALRQLVRGLTTRDDG